MAKKIVLTTEQCAHLADRLESLYDEARQGGIDFAKTRGRMDYPDSFIAGWVKGSLCLIAEKLRDGSISDI